jgi:hypothetical protein
MTFRLTLALLLAFHGLTSAQSLNGVIDIHVHSDPDSVPRPIDAIEAARLARVRGFRAIVLKNHFESTAALAYEVRHVVPKIEIFGGIALNRSVGGLNAVAVEKMARLKGGYGRIVWMPTADAEHQVKGSGESRPFVAISRDGRLLPAVTEVIDVIARNRLVLATGHSSPAESLMLVREARARGVRSIVITHPLMSSIGMSLEQMKQATALDAYIELVAYTVIGANATVSIKDFVRVIRTVGPEHCILASDLGQPGNPLHADGLDMLFSALRREGIPAADIERMSKVNPARLLGLQ